MITVPAILVWVSFSMLLCAPAGEPKTAPPSRAAWERLKTLVGKWEAKSTKGWEEKTEYQLIAADSVLMETSFDAHPGQKMVTMFHMDGENLMLTHYCVAKNQPRLKATEFSPDGKRIVFTFLDATNLASRDKGHMDKCVVEFNDDGTFSTQWTWYQNGKEDWMEKIDSRRAAATAQK